MIPSYLHQMGARVCGAFPELYLDHGTFHVEHCAELHPQVPATLIVFHVEHC